MVGSHGRSKQHRRAFLKSATVGTLATRMARRTDRAQAWQDDTASVVRSPVERIAPDELDESLRGIELVEFWYDPALAERAPHPIYAAIPNPDYDVFADLQGPHTGHERVTLAVNGSSRSSMSTGPTTSICPPSCRSRRRWTRRS